MSKKRSNPYRDGTAYAAVFAALSKAGQKGVTRKDLLKNHAPADVTVVLSPRAEGESRGDCRGNMSAQGHVYFVGTRTKDGEKRFNLRWRKVELEPRKRQAKAKVEQKKVSTKKGAKSKSRSRAKAKA
jgi:hypothetical protein